MSNDEFLVFLKDVLIKIENAINLVEQNPSRHIPSYNKMLGVKQKLLGVDEKYKNKIFTCFVSHTLCINYFMNGKYDEAYNCMLKIKKDLIKICFDIENEKNKE